MQRALSFLTCQTPVGRFLRGSKCCKISSFKSGNSLRVGKLAMLSLKYLRCRFHRGLLSLRRLRLMIEVISVRSASAKRARPRDQATVNVTKCARSSTSTSRRSLSPRRDYPRGTSSVTRSSQASPKHAEDRPVHAQDLEVFKADMTSILADMLKSSLSNFASQLKSSSGGQGGSESKQNVTSDQESTIMMIVRRVEIFLL